MKCELDKFIKIAQYIIIPFSLSYSKPSLIDQMYPIMEIFLELLIYTIMSQCENRSWRID